MEDVVTNETRVFRLPVQEPPSGKRARIPPGCSLIHKTDCIFRFLPPFIPQKRTALEYDGVDFVRHSYKRHR